jgi:type IV pilus assembly protein PilM
MQLLTSTFDSFGLDIGDRSLKAAYIKKRGSDFELKSYGSIDMPKGIFEQGVIIDQNKFENSIIELLKSVKPKNIPTSYVHACLPETHTFIKVITIEAVKKEKLATAIREELPNHIPLNPDDLYIDWHVVSDMKQNTETIDVLVGAIPKTTSDSYTKSLHKLGLKPISLQIEAEAILRSILPTSVIYSEPIAIIDIGATRASFICFDNKTIQFTVSMSMASDDITASIKEKLNLSEEKAEEAKRICGLDPTKGDQAIYKILEPSFIELSHSIKQNLSFYIDHFNGAQPIKSIILCGGGANLLGLVPMLSKQLPELKIYLGNPLINLVKKRKDSFKDKEKINSFDFAGKKDSNQELRVPKDLTQAKQLGFTTAIGLALSNVI